MPVPHPSVQNYCVLSVNSENHHLQNQHVSAESVIGNECRQEFKGGTSVYFKHHTLSQTEH